MRFECRNLTFQYPNSTAYVFHHLSFALCEPGFHALFGPSGVGKTSLARIITGDLQGYTGEVAWPKASLRLYSYNLERLPGWSTIGRHLEKVTPAARGVRREELVAAFGIEDCLEQRFAQLSLGQRNRVNLIRYLLQDFDLLIMDESLANVDELTRAAIILKIKELYPEKMFLYISHNVVEVSRFCQQIWVCRQAFKSPQAVLVPGQDHRQGLARSQPALETTMLEIMNAA